MKLNGGWKSAMNWYFRSLAATRFAEVNRDMVHDGTEADVKLTQLYSPRTVTQQNGLKDKPTLTILGVCSMSWRWLVLTLSGLVTDVLNGKSCDF